MYHFLKIRSLKRYFDTFAVIPLGFEPKTHSLEGCCSNPTELRNQATHHIADVFIGCKGNAFF